MYNIIADVAGRYTELMNLIKIMPQNNKIILVGDLIDRGPDSKKVVEWAMANSLPEMCNPIVVLKGNHEVMMIEASCSDHYVSDHLYNGGRATLKSYGVEHPSMYPRDHLEWMNALPLFFEHEGLFVSHAPWIGVPGEFSWEHAAVWNRYSPDYTEGLYQIHGHNGEMELYYKNDIEYGRCIDNCRNKVLMGFTWPTKKVYEVPYV